VKAVLPDIVVLDLEGVSDWIASANPNRAVIFTKQLMKRVAISASSEPLPAVAGSRPSTP